MPTTMLYFDVIKSGVKVYELQHDFSDQKAYC